MTAVFALKPVAGFRFVDVMLLFALGVKWMN